MNKAFVKESTDDDEDADGASAPALPPGTKNYLTPEGYARLRAEMFHLLHVDRPEVVRTVSWAASNGDRSENGDYLYGKKRLREIDRRVRFLTKRLDLAEIVDTALHHGSDQVFFGATVEYDVDGDGVTETRTVTIVGVDEADPLQGRISWIAPIARALVKARVGDVVQLRTPAGAKEIEILDVRYPTPSADR